MSQPKALRNLILLASLLALGGVAVVATWPRAKLVLKDLPEPEVSVPSGAFARPFQVELSVPGGAGEVRYTLDDSEPDQSSPVYQRPLSIRKTTFLAARTFSPAEGGAASGAIARRSYLLVDGEVARFRSELPVVVIETSGREIQRYRDSEDQPTPYLSCVLQVFEPDGAEGSGLTSLSGPASFSGRAAVKARGSSTLGREKSSFTVEIRDAAGQDLAVPLLGLPGDSDWVLLAPLDFDRALLRDALVYELARRCGRYAPRTRFVEVFLNEDGGAVSGPVPAGKDYYGVYLLVEKIKRGRDRVAVERLTPADRLPPAVAGGYILKIDRPGPGEQGFRVGRQRFHHVYPKESEISSEQAAWIAEHLATLQSALDSPGFDDPETGYQRYLEVDSAIDYHLLNEFAKNPDSYVYSTYLHKPREGKVALGPVWDFDRSMGCDFDRRAQDPNGWSRNCFRFWYRRLFQAPRFVERYWDRWRKLREGPFQEDRLLELIDAMAEDIAAAAERETERWGRVKRLRRGEWRAEIAQLKSWVRARLEWFDRASR